MGHNHTSHMWVMAIACGGALLLILVLPFLGLSKNWSVGISIAFMIGLHLWMMQGHSHMEIIKITRRVQNELLSK